MLSPRTGGFLALLGLTLAMALDSSAQDSSAQDSSVQSSLVQVLVPKESYELAPHLKGNAYAPTVLIEAGLWRMWYGAQGTDGHDRICYAESRDGKNWVSHGVVLEDPAANHINDPSVLFDSGKYWMYYTRAEKFIFDEVWLAASEDGRNWKPFGAVLTPNGEGMWDSLSVGRPSVLRHNGQFMMWYDGRKDFPPGTPVEGAPISESSHRYVGLAVSSDGINWARHSNNPVFGNDAGGVDVKYLDDRFHLLFESHEGTRWATSIDGIRWNDNGFLVRCSGTPLDRHGHVTPHLFQEGRKYTLFFGAARASNWNQNSLASMAIDWSPAPRDENKKGSEVIDGFR